MKEIPTAEEFYKQTTGCVMNHRDIKVAMIEFAKMHVEAALKEASGKAKVQMSKDYVVSEIRLHPNSLVDTAVITVNASSILNSYSLTNIK